MRKFILVIAVFLFFPAIVSSSVELHLESRTEDGENLLLNGLVITDELFDGYVDLEYYNLESGIGGFGFNKTSFNGNGPYIYNHSWNAFGLNTGEYVVYAELKNKSGIVLDNVEVSGTINSSAPRILSKSPEGIVTTQSVSISVETDEDAVCKYSLSDVPYDSMSNSFTLTGGKSHSQVITGLGEGKHSYYVRCRDLHGHVMNESELISFIVDFPPSAEISLSDTSPVKAGVVEVTVVTSEELDNAPRLEYSFNDAPASRKIVSLSGSGSLWKGYMIITEDDDNKVGTFYFRGEDSLGNTGDVITEGKIFLVDTTKPPAPINIEAIMLPSGDVKVRWYYEGEPVDYFNVYRSTTSGVDYIDYYSSTGNFSQYVDSSTADKVTYYYKVAAVDMAGNIGPLSDEVYATSIKKGKVKELEENKTKEEPKVLPPNLVIKVNDMIKKFEQLEIDIDDVSSRFESIGGEEKAIVNNLAIFDKLFDAKTKIDENKKKLEELKSKYKTPSELDSELKLFDLELKRIRNSIPKRIRLIDKAEYMQSLDEEDIKEAVNLVFSELDEKERDDYVRGMGKISEKIGIEVKLKVVTFEYLDETSKEITLVSKKISYLNPDFIEDVIVVEIIPKTVAESIDEIDFKSGEYEVIKSDPIIKYGFLKLDYEGRTIEYEIEKKVNLAKLKESRTIVLVGPKQLEKTSEVVGYSVFSLLGKEFRTNKKEKYAIISGFIIIILLFGYYLIFIRAGFGFRVTGKRKNIRMPTFKVSKRGGPEENTLMYPEVHKLSTGAISEEDRRLREIRKVIMLANGFLSADDFDKAEIIYPKVEMLYRRLPRELKKEVYRECMDLKRSIEESKREFYKSIF